MSKKEEQVLVTPARPGAMLFDEPLITESNQRQDVFSELNNIVGTMRYLSEDEKKKIDRNFFKGFKRVGVKK